MDIWLGAPHMCRTFFIALSHRKIFLNLKATATFRRLMDIYCELRSASHARIRFRCSDLQHEVRGTIRGPFCKYARTLPATFPIEEGQAVVVDPCYWTPRMPFRYEVRVSLTHETGKVEQEQFLWGLRCCMPHKNSLYLDRKRYVVRAVSIPEAQVDLSQLRELSCGLVMESPTDVLCEAASELGVMIVQTAEHSATSLRALNRHPAIHFAFGEDTMRWTNVLPLSRTADTRNSSIALVDERVVASQRQSESPIMVRRECRSSDIAQMRHACDELQRDMATHGQFAGYIVTGVQ